MNRVLAWMVLVMAVAVVASLIEVALHKPQPQQIKRVVMT